MKHGYRAQLALLCTFVLMGCTTLDKNTGGDGGGDGGGANAAADSGNGTGKSDAGTSDAAAADGGKVAGQPGKKVAYMVPTSGGSVGVMGMSGKTVDFEFPKTAAGKAIMLTPIAATDIGWPATQFAEVIKMEPDGATFKDPIVVRPSGNDVIVLDFKSGTTKSAPEGLPLAASGDGFLLSHFSTLVIVPAATSCDSVSGWQLGSASDSQTHCSADPAFPQYISFSCNDTPYCLNITADCCAPAGATACELGDVPLAISYTAVTTPSSKYPYCAPAVDAGTGGSDAAVDAAVDSGVICTANAQSACVCPTGVTGSRTCAQDGRSYTSCVCSVDAGVDSGIDASVQDASTQDASVDAGADGGAGGTDSSVPDGSIDGGQSGCVASSMQLCDCGGGLGLGWQFCDSQGISWGACTMCGTVDAGAGADGGTTADAGAPDGGTADGGGTFCTPYQANPVSCDCGGGPGAQYCDGSGTSWGVCMCIGDGGVADGGGTSDGGVSDAGVTCASGQVLACDNVTCLDKTQVTAYVSNGTCDAIMNCAMFSYDNGSCSDGGVADAGVTCASGQTLACDNVTCLDSAQVMVYGSNGTCDTILNCSKFAYDNGNCSAGMDGGTGTDAGVTCASGQMLACDNVTCLDKTQITTYQSNGTCDAILNCAMFAYDNGNCTDGGAADAGVTCASGQTLACDNVTCLDSAQVMVYGSNGTCDAILNCSKFAYDNGNCSAGMDAGTDAGAGMDAGVTCASGQMLACDNVTCLDSAQVMVYASNGTCDAILNCAMFAYDNGNCSDGGVADAGVTCPSGQMLACDNVTCLDKTQITTYQSNGTCDAILNCAMFAYDNGNCSAGMDAGTDAGTSATCDQTGKWTAMGTVPDAEQLHGVWAYGSNDSAVWAVGNSTSTMKALIGYYDGVSWTSQTVGAAGDVLYAVWGVDPNNVFAVGSGGAMYHYTAGAWSSMNSPTVKDLHAMWGADPNHYWVVGAQGAAFYWDGTQWNDKTIVSDPGVDDIGTLHGIWGRAVDNIWVVTDNGAASNSIHVVHHYSAGAWTADPSTAWNYYSKALWGSTTTDIWAVGYSKGNAAHYDGSAWTAMGAPPAGGAGYLESVAGRDSSHVWAVGDGGRIDFWNGSAWSTCIQVTQLDLLGVSSSASKLWAVGVGGIVLRND